MCAPCTPHAAEATGTRGSPGLGAPARPHLLLLPATGWGQARPRQRGSCSAQGGLALRAARRQRLPQGSLPANETLSSLCAPGRPLPCPLAFATAPGPGLRDAVMSPASTRNLGKLGFARGVAPPPGVRHSPGGGGGGARSWGAAGLTPTPCSDPRPWKQSRTRSCGSRGQGHASVLITCLPSGPHQPEARHSPVLSATPSAAQPPFLWGGVRPSGTFFLNGEPLPPTPHAPLGEVGASGACSPHVPLYWVQLSFQNIVQLPRKGAEDPTELLCSVGVSGGPWQPGPLPAAGPLHPNQRSDLLGVCACTEDHPVQAAGRAGRGAWAVVPAEHTGCRTRGPEPF